MNKSYTDDQHISLHPMLPWLVLASAVSIAMMVLGAGRVDRLLVPLAAALFAAFVVGAGLGVNSPLWSRENSRKGMPKGSMRSAVRCNIWLAALVYFWGASSLFGIYSLGGLSWYHANQYAAGALVFALGLSFLAWRIGSVKSAELPRLVLSVIHGAAALGGLIFLIVSGKLATKKDDWAANEVFVWGAVAVIALCIMSILTQLRRVREPEPQV